jgi:hypothetical protein
MACGLPWVSRTLGTTGSLRIYAEKVVRFVWACASLTLSRRMLSLRQATVITGARTLSVHSAGGTGQPRRDMFESYRRSSGLDFDHTKHAWVGGDEIELGQVEIHRVS